MQTQRRAREIELLREYSDIVIQPKFDAGVHEPRTRARMYAAGAALPRVFLRRRVKLSVVDETIYQIDGTISGAVLRAGT